MRLRFSSFELDVPRRALTRDGSAIHLTPKAFDLIHLLATQAPRVLTKQELHDTLWPDAFVSEANLTGLIKELRRALDDHDHACRIIRTAHGIGYALDVAVANAPTHAALPLYWLVLNGRRVPLSPGENIVGRDPAAQVWLDASGISRRHARVVVTAGDVQLEDCGSKNGTTANDVPVTTPVPLRDGDRICFGSIVAVYRSSLEALSTQSL